MLTLIKNCRAEGEVTANALKSGNVVNFGIQAGGLVGELKYGEVKDSCADTRVQAIGGYYSHAGGICGIVASADEYAIGSGWNTEIISNSYALVENCFASGDVYAKDAYMQNNAGGIAGQMQGASSVIEACASNASISASGKPGYFNGVGGLVGAAYNNSRISDSYSVGSVASTGGDAAIGGIAGRTEAVIERCYTISKLNAENSWSDYLLNSLVGPIRSGITANGCGVFNIAKPHFVSGTDMNIVISPVSTENLIKADTYKAFKWDFDTVWTFAGNGTYKLPILRGINEELQKNLQMPN
jgi:hypothetical protein